jgi:RNA polymerase sigma-70 factor (ECF subfamily)
MWASQAGPDPGRGGKPDLNWLLDHVARGDQGAFEAVYDRLAGPVYGLICKVVRDPAQSEEVAQEVLLEVWRTSLTARAARRPGMMIAHRRAHRPGPASAEVRRDQKTAAAACAPGDEVAGPRIDARRTGPVALPPPTDVQRESITLAYYTRL